MGQLEDVKNLGPKSSEWLRLVGIHSLRDLEDVGSVEAFLRIRSAGLNASLNLLWALEAGLQGIHWTDLSEASKRELKRLVRSSSSVRGE